MLLMVVATLGLRLQGGKMFNFENVLKAVKIDTDILLSQSIQEKDYREAAAIQVLRGVNTLFSWNRKHFNIKYEDTLFYFLFAIGCFREKKVPTNLDEIVAMIYRLVDDFQSYLLEDYNER